MNIINLRAIIGIDVDGGWAIHGWSRANSDSFIVPFSQLVCDHIGKVYDVRIFDIEINCQVHDKGITICSIFSSQVRPVDGEDFKGIEEWPLDNIGGL